LHPLPCLCHGAKTRKPKDISKNGKYWFEEFTGREWWKSTGGWWCVWLARQAG
jgi:hypothetical protein